MSQDHGSERCDPNTVEIGPRAALGVLMCLFAFMAFGYFIAGVAAPASADTYLGSLGEPIHEKGAIE